MRARPSSGCRAASRSRNRSGRTRWRTAVPLRPAVPGDVATARLGCVPVLGAGGEGRHHLRRARLGRTRAYHAMYNPKRSEILLVFCCGAVDEAGGREMSISFDPVSATNEAANWINSILTRKRNKRIAAAANIIYNSGIIVIEMRSLRDRMKNLFGPLRGFNPTDWPADRRATLIGKLREFADRLPTFGVMVEHAFALEQLTVQPVHDVVRLRDKIIQNALSIGPPSGRAPSRNTRPRALARSSQLVTY